MSPPLPRQRTRVTTWTQRHLGSLALVAAPLAAGLSTAVGSLSVDPLKALTTLGIPVGLCVLLFGALTWTYLVLIPRQSAEEEERRQAILDAHRQDLDLERATLREIVETFTKTTTTLRAALDALTAEVGALRSFLIDGRTPPYPRPAATPTVPSSTATLR